jgi:hypothetical protein
VDATIGAVVEVNWVTPAISAHENTRKGLPERVYWPFMHEKSSLVTKDFQSLVGRSKIKTWMKKTPRIMELGTISMSKERPMIYETRKGAPVR